MIDVRGTPVTINGRTGGTPGPATTTMTRVPIPLPPGRARPGSPLAPATTFARYLRIACVDSTNDLRVAFLDGTYVTITHGGAPVEFGGNIPFFSVQAAASTSQWEAYVVVAS